MNFKNKVMRTFKNRAQKIQYLKDVRDGKHVRDAFLYSLLTLSELKTLQELLEKYGRIDENNISPEDKSRIEAIEKKYNERVAALTKDELDLVKKDYRYFTIGEQAIKVQQIKERLQII